jgi:cytochrome P450
LIGNGMRLLATRPELQEALRADPKLIPDFVEEVLRFDGSVKAEGRLCVQTKTVGGVEIKAGTSVFIALMGANRDKRRFEDGDLFRLGRPKGKEHLAFGRGAHTCIGAPLARSEARVSFERLLARMGNIRVAGEHRDSAGDYRFEYEPTFILRALKNLHLEFDPM